jgi:geranylgeranyl pyrophosphate synthase
MPVVAALAAGDDGARELESLLFDGPAPHHNGSVVVTDQVTMTGPDWSPAPLRHLSHDDLARATWLVEACGGREWTAARAKAHLDAALGSLERARLSAVPRRALADLAVYVVERES